jgi:hypothetical protein
MRAAMGRGPKQPRGLHELGTLGIVSALLAIALVASGADGVSATGAATAAPFTFTFDGNPSSPQPWKPSTWDVVVNSRDTRTFVQLESMQAQHGSDCGPYPATHVNNTYEGAVFLCHNHVMTAINAGGYGEIVLTPDHMVDFSGGETTIRFDLSTLRTSFRDWPSIWITPFEDNLVLPIDGGERVDLQGPPQRGIQLRMDKAAGGSIWRATLVNNFKATALPFKATKSLETLVGSPSAVNRTTFELTVSRTHIKFGAPKLGFNWVDTTIAELPWSRGVVQLAHHSYNPIKHCTPTATLTCQPDTWHWSNFYVSNAVPFTLLRGDQQVLHGTYKPLSVTATPSLVSFPGPAPQSAYLRFAAVGAIDISLDGGKQWQPAHRQNQLYSYIDHFSSYFTPIPAGTRSVSIRGHNWGWGTNPGYPWWVRDVAIWSASVPSAGASPAPPPAAAPKVAAPTASTPHQATGLTVSTVLAAVRTPTGLAGGSAGLLILGGIVVWLWLRRRRPSRPDRP